MSVSTCLAQAQLCHPKIGYVDLSVIPLSTRMEITPTLPQIPDTKLMVTSKVQFLQLPHVFFSKCKNTIPHTSDDTRCHLNLLNISSRHFVSVFTINSTSLAAPKANPKYSMLQIKTYFTKTHFDSRHLRHHPPFIS